MGNIHVVFVHFPVALLTLYAILEIAHFKQLRALPYWFYLKAAFLLIGELGALAALLTGESAERTFPRASSIHRVIETHSTFGATTALFFGILSIIYLAAWIGRVRGSNRLTGSAERFVASPWMVILGLAGLALITITGALGGAIAFGPNVDPAAHLIYGWFNF